MLALADSTALPACSCSVQSRSACSGSCKVMQLMQVVKDSGVWVQCHPRRDEKAARPQEEVVERGVEGGFEMGAVGEGTAPQPGNWMPPRPYAQYSVSHQRNDDSKVWTACEYSFVNNRHMCLMELSILQDLAV